MHPSSKPTKACRNWTEISPQKRYSGRGSVGGSGGCSGGGSGGSGGSGGGSDPLTLDPSLCDTICVALKKSTFFYFYSFLISPSPSFISTPLSSPPPLSCIYPHADPESPSSRVAGGGSRQGAARTGHRWATDRACYPHLTSALIDITLT